MMMDTVMSRTYPSSVMPRICGLQTYSSDDGIRIIRPESSRLQPPRVKAQEEEHGRQHDSDDRSCLKFVDTRLFWICLAETASKSNHLYNWVSQYRKNKQTYTDGSGPGSHKTSAHMLRVSPASLCSCRHIRPGP